MTIGRAIRESPLQIVGNGQDRSANLPTCWGRLPHSVGRCREATEGDRRRQRVARAKRVTEGQNHSKIRGRAWKPAPTTGRRDADPYARNGISMVGRGLAPAVNLH